MANIKVEPVAQFEGFGNDVPKVQGEYFRSMGFSRSLTGISSSKYLYKWFYSVVGTYPQISALSSIHAIAEGYGRSIDTDSGSTPYLFAVDNNGVIVQSSLGITDPQIVYYTNKNGSHYGAGTGTGGLIVDQKKRLLYVGERYLGKFDPATADVPVTGSFTNGSASFSVSPSSLVAGHDEKLIRLVSAGKYYYYRIQSIGSSSTATLYSNFDLPTGSYLITVLNSWTDQWKDFGASYTLNSEGYNAHIPCEVYEDTVLFGRGNVITSLNTLTDSITTDASPAFTLPTGFDTLSIHRGSNGILIGSNFQGKGVLVLWDNFSDRSIAPWIVLPDRLISMAKYNGGWLVKTARERFYTNGYSLTSLSDKFLDSSMTVYATNLIPQSSVVSENNWIDSESLQLSGRRRSGLYSFNVSSKLSEFYPRQSLDLYNNDIKAIYYGSNNGNGRVYVGTTTSLDYLAYSSEPALASYITNPVGQGDNYKYAEGIKLNLGISSQVYTAESPFSFTVTTKICPMTKQLFNYGVLKTTQSSGNSMTVDETLYETAEEGDEIEFLSGNNAGYSRNIISISGGGTNTAVYTLDRAFPNLSSANDNYQRSSFKLIKSKTYTNVTEMPEVFHDIKNKVKAKKFLLKVEIEGATVPIEIRPFYFIYDDLGTI